MNFKILIILTLIFFYGFIIKAQENVIQTFSLSGQVVDTLQNTLSEPVSVAIFSAKNGQLLKSVMCNEQGLFLISEINPDEYVIKINTFSYKAFSQKILIDTNVYQKIYLQKNDIEIQDVKITGEKQIYKLESDKRVYLTANDESVQNAFAVDAVQNAPGVFLDTNGKFKVRGKDTEIWINGKNINSNFAEVGDYLQTISASTIERIEVITNPSAQYSSTETSSIINIVLKKKSNDNNLVAFGTNTSTIKLYGGWFSLYIRLKKISFNIYSSAWDSEKPRNYYTKSYKLTNADTIFLTENTQIELFKMSLNNLYGQISYNINENNVFEFSIVAGKNQMNYDDSYNKIRRFDNAYSLISDWKDNSSTASIIASASFNHSFSKKSSFNLSFENRFFLVENSYNKTNIFNIDNIQKINSLSESNTSRYLINGEFISKINDKYTFKSGFSLMPNSSYKYSEVVENTSGTEDITTINNELSNKYIRIFIKYGIYSTFSGSLSKLNYNLGLRFESDKFFYTQSLPLPVNNFNRTFNNFFPSINISYDTKSNNSFSISYSKRNTSPLYNLSPYVNRKDIDNLFSGNPNLDDALINSFDASYYRDFGKIQLTTSIYYQKTKNDILPVISYIYDDYYKRNIILNSFANCADNNYTGIEVNFVSKNINKLTVNANINLYYRFLKGEFENIPIESKSFASFNTLKLMYKISDKINIIINPGFTSSQDGFFEKTQKYYTVDSKLNLKFFDNKLSIDISAFDIFKTNIENKSYYLDEFYSISIKDFHNQKIKLSVVYRIGNLKYERQAKVNQLSNGG